METEDVVTETPAVSMMEASKIAWRAFRKPILIAAAVTAGLVLFARATATDLDDENDETTETTE